MAETIKLIVGTGGALGLIVALIIAIINALPSRVTARAVDRRIALDERQADDKADADRLAAAEKQRDYWMAQFQTEHTSRMELEHKLLACEGQLLMRDANDMRRDGFIRNPHTNPLSAAETTAAEKLKE